jgi:hypothetical protein
VRRPTARWDLGFAALLVLALTLCLLQTVAIVRFRDPSPSIVAKVGEPVELDGVRILVDRFDVGPELPPRPDEDPVVAMTGASLVGVGLRVEITDPARDPGQLSCTFTLVDDRNRRWNPDWDVRRTADLPERLTCAGSEDYPVFPNQPYAVGVAFMVPADAADRVRLRLELESDRVLVEFAR